MLCTERPIHSHPDPSQQPPFLLPAPFCTERDSYAHMTPSLNLVPLSCPANSCPLAISVVPQVWHTSGITFSEENRPRKDTCPSWE